MEPKDLKKTEGLEGSKNAEEKKTVNPAVSNEQTEIKEQSKESGKEKELNDPEISVVANEKETKPEESEEVEEVAAAAPEEAVSSSTESESVETEDDPADMQEPSLESVTVEDEDQVEPEEENTTKTKSESVKDSEEDADAEENEKELETITDQQVSSDNTENTKNEAQLDESEKNKESEIIAAPVAEKVKKEHKEDKKKEPVLTKKE